MRKETNKKLPKLQYILVVLFATAWLVPVALFSYFIFHDYQKAYVEKSEDLNRNAVRISGVLFSSEIDDAITKLQKPTYDGDLENMYNKYENGSLTKAGFLTSIRSMMTSRFYMDRQVLQYAFYMKDQDAPDCYAGKNGYGYADYLENAHPAIRQVIQEGSNYVQVLVLDNQLYLVRNLYTVSDYRMYGSIVLGLKRESLVDSMPLENLADVRISMNDQPQLYEAVTKRNGKSQDKDPKKEELYGKLLEMDKENALSGNILNGVDSLTEDGFVGYCYHYTSDDYRMSFFYLLEENTLYSGISRLNTLAFASLVVIAILMVLTFRFLRRQIDKPLGTLNSAALQIKEGDFGAVIETPMPNREFDQMAESFNAMSAQIKHLFDTVYTEQMARKDAQISALQAQINPHFFNNTLEMMNWQARMNGDVEVCKMIEALSTVLDSGMNRSDDKLVRLSEELRCGDAFLYIMSMRFGARLQVEKEVDDSLLQVMVPGLILQPLLENAIRHGIEVVNSGTIWLKISHEEDLLHIDVINTGKGLTEGELQRIRDIISGKNKLDKKEPGVHTSIGIYNVNKRIRLIFGEEYGLTVSALSDQRVMSRITIPYREGII